jgi:heme-degrading monooxygenase HmoA
MFLINEILNFTPGRRQEALDRLSYIHGLMAPSPGFVQAIVAKYLGDGTKHTVLRFWQDEAAYQKFREGPNGNYGRNRPEGLYNNDQVVPQWNSFDVADGSGSGAYLVKVQQPVPEEAWDGFMDVTKRISAVATGLGGMVSSRHFRAKDRSEGLTVARFRGRDDLEKMLESPAFVQIVAPMMAAGGPPPSTQCYEVVSEVGPK